MNTKYFENTSCPICREKFKNSAIFNFEYETNSVLTSIAFDEEYPIVTLKYCECCHHNYADPQISDAALASYYLNNSVFYSKERLEQSDHQKWRHNFIKSQICKFKPNGKILDVGCGVGHLLSCFDDSNFEKYGIDPSDNAINTAKNNNNASYKVGFLDENSYDFKFDIITLIDVVEHLKNPNYLLKIIFNYLNPDGIVVIGTGDSHAQALKVAKSHWTYFGSWEHISFFNRKSISYLFNLNDLRVVHTVNYTNSNPYSRARVKEHIKAVFGILAHNFGLKFLSRIGKNNKLYFSINNDHFLTIGKMKTSNGEKII